MTDSERWQEIVYGTICALALILIGMLIVEAWWYRVNHPTPRPDRRMQVQHAHYDPDDDNQAGA